MFVDDVPLPPSMVYELRSRPTSSADLTAPPSQQFVVLGDVLRTLRSES